MVARKTMTDFSADNSGKLKGFLWLMGVAKNSFEDRRVIYFLKTVYIFWELQISKLFPALC